ncbi:MAG: hypothetical protein R2810_04645 [Flavobacteriales bacterium]
MGRFGKERVRNTPLCGAPSWARHWGSACRALKAMVEMQFADFVSEGITQMLQQPGEDHYRWGQHADVVVRMPTGAGVGAGPSTVRATRCGS